MTGASIAIAQTVVYRLHVTSMRFEYRAHRCTVAVAVTITVADRVHTETETETDSQTRARAVPLSPRSDHRIKRDK